MQLTAILSILSLAALGTATPVAAALEPRQTNVANAPCYREGKPEITAPTDIYPNRRKVALTIRPQASTYVRGMHRSAS